MKATIVFQKNWEAINERNKDGSNKYRYIVNCGSSRSSKTVSLIQLYDLYARSFKSKRLTAWRDTKTDCKKTVLNDMLKCLKREKLYKVGQIFNKTESIFTYNSDSTVEIHGTDDEETVHGLTQDCAWLNEPYKISKDTFDQIDQRTSDFIFIDYNPKKDHWVNDIIKDSRTIVIHSTFKDNPFCPEESKRKILSYQPLEMCKLIELNLIDIQDLRKYDFVLNTEKFTQGQIKEARICLDNEEKNSASKFKWEVYGLGLKSEKPNRIFNWNEISDNDYFNISSEIYYGCDWGKVDPWGIIEAKYYDGNLYLHELNYLSENQHREQLTLNDRNKVDAYNKDENIQNEGIVSWLFEKLKVDKNRPIICDNNRPTKIALLRRNGYSAYPAKKGAGSIEDGIDLLSNLNIFYTKSSINIAYEQENYSMKTDRYGTILESPEDMDNHLIDPTRYVVTYLQSLGIIKNL